MREELKKCRYDMEYRQNRRDFSEERAGREGEESMGCRPTFSVKSADILRRVGRRPTSSPSESLHEADFAVMVFRENLQRVSAFPLAGNTQSEPDAGRHGLFPILHRR